MLDRWTSGLVRPYLHRSALVLNRFGITPNAVTITGFCIGTAAVAALLARWYGAALVCILLNRVADGLDGALARVAGSTDSGAYLDIVLDFIFYGGVVVGFGFAEPETNSLAAAALLFSFTGTGSSFLSFAILAERRGLQNIRYPLKGFYYLGGLTEGSETLLFFVAFCLFPGFFPQLAWCFAGMCIVTTVTRVIGGYNTIRAHEEENRQE